MRNDYLDKYICQISLDTEDGVNILSFNTWLFIDLLSVGDVECKKEMVWCMLITTILKKKLS